MSRGSILGYVGKSIHHATAQGATGDLHVTDIRPFTSFNIKALNVKGSGEAVEAPDHKEAVIDHCNAKVTAGAQHGGHSTPGVSVGVIGLSRAQTASSIETANL